MSANLPSPQSIIVDLSSIGRTNRIYSEEEEAYIRNILLASRQQKEELVDLIDRCEVALAPHKKLPPDVLRSIFHACNETRVEFPLSMLDTDLRLFHITHVCSAWRQLALETPALWSDVGIHLSCMKRSWHHEVLSPARQWFARAQDMSRSLFIDLTWLEVYDSPHLRDAWEQILEFVALYRLRDLELRYPINHLTLKLPDHAWPSIERLHLTGNTLDTINIVNTKSPFSDFGSLPNLKHLTIRHASNLHGLDNVVQCHQLRILDMRQWIFKHSEISPSSCLNVLRQCQLLEFCSLPLAKEPSFVSTVASRDEKIVLANMDYLRLKFFDGSAASAFLQPLVTPNITTFILEISPEKSWTQLNCDMPALIGIIQRSAGMRQIHHLEIDTSPLLNIGILLELLPSLQFISIKSGHLTDNAIEGLSSGKLGPLLYYMSSDHMHDAADKILSMVESRYQNATKFSDGGKQIERWPSPFKYISIPCTASRDYHSRIESLSLSCDADLYLGIEEDLVGSEEEDSEDEYEYEEYIGAEDME
ncbi:hypothetical protein F5887DRAFT_505476 [Amanita rubescens]|nr:hypothetical protein F5887DRAFT_505476 [Amanita rubescens]